MENFIVSARKYRPKSFEDVIGQEHVTITLRKAIEQNHLAQALLFTGPRGVGKTTCARILARMINQDESDFSDQDFSFNIFELDAASNNSVDDIRNLTDQVRFAPQSGNYKVYIIDEVHMLSTAAFNAFLKTLEEPPAHAIFILATTEKHKIIPTILSRCQIYDFRRISVEDITRHLEEVAKKEGIEIEHEGLIIIAQKADGALRDALSIFDRIVAFSGNRVSYQDVIDNLRILDYDFYFRTTESILKGDQSALLLIFDEILNRGFDGHHYINGLAAHFRDLLVCKDARTLELLEVGENIRQRYRQQSEAVEINWLLKALKLAAEIDSRYKGSNNPRLLVELCLLQMSQLESEHQEKKSPAQGSWAPEQPADKSYSKSKAQPRPVTPQKEINTRHEPEVIEVAPAAKENPDPKNTDATSDKVEKPASNPQKPRRKKNLKASIMEALSDREEAKEEEEIKLEGPPPDLPKDSFDQNLLDNLWGAYLQNMKNSGRQKNYSSLSNKKLRYEKDFKLSLQLDNDIQIDFFHEEKTELLHFLREKLNNYALHFEIKKREQAQTLEPYSPQEKYEYMVKKNPHLHTLRQKLDLDIE